MRRVLPWVAAVVAATACSPPAPTPLPPGSFAFGVFGDGPYTPFEQRPWRNLLADVDRVSPSFLIHVGDIIGSDCSDATYRERAAQFTGVTIPLVYVPGDNEWTDCHGRRRGGADPLERLATLRRVFYTHPEQSWGRTPIPLRTQARDSGYTGYPEDALWHHGGIVFATLHVVGSGNGLAGFRGRTAASDSEVVHRMAATLAWLDTSFADATRSRAPAVVLAMHAEMELEDDGEPREAYGEFVRRLRDHVAAFPGQVVLVHGDSHDQRMDHPLRDAGGKRMRNFTRIETYGSPEIGWLRVVMDTASGKVVRVDRRLMHIW